MTNFEKYKDEMLNLKGGVAFSNGKIVSCETLRCEDCSFYKNDGKQCDIEFIKWLYEDDGELKGCGGCKYEDRREGQYPCVVCINCYTSKWEPRPKKTRQDEFLEMFPNAKTVDSVINICPKRIDKKFDRCTYSCIECHKDYWLQEVE